MMTDHNVVQEIINEIGKVIVGKHDQIQLTIAAFLAQGHVLFEDVPGIGKTMLVRSFSRVLNQEFRRVQFTPDLLPSDVIGISIYSQKDHDFIFKKGPIFTDLLLADEINRTTPRTQAALLEAMSERQVTVDGQTMPLGENFFVLATQNPLQFEGTYTLPEAQLDRFLLRLSMGYPSFEEELQLISGIEPHNKLKDIRPIMTPEVISELRTQIQHVHISESLYNYALELVSATRNHPSIQLGISPRGSINFIKAAKAYAVTENRNYCLPDDFKKLMIPVFSHRVRMKSSQYQASTALQDILDTVSVPVE